MADASLYGGAYAAIGSGIASAITASSDSRIAADDAKAANGIRAANNASSQAWADANAKITALQRWAQGVRNSRVYESVARNQEALATNFNRSRDARTRSNFSDSIRQAEEAGRMQAAAAASGITGSVVQVLDTTRELRNGIQDRDRVNTEAQVKSDFSLAQFQQRWAILDQLDNGLILDTPAKIDYGTTLARPTTSVGSAFIAGAGAKGLQQIGIAAGNFFNFDKNLPDPFGGNAGIGDK